jgi:hypothetical protein
VCSNTIYQLYFQISSDFLQYVSTRHLVHTVGIFQLAIACTQLIYFNLSSYTQLDLLELEVNVKVVENEALGAKHQILDEQFLQMSSQFDLLKSEKKSYEAALMEEQTKLHFAAGAYIYLLILSYF